MKKIAVIMNTNEVGGAERSLVFQMQNMLECEITFFIPEISKSKKLEIFLKTFGFNNIEYYSYPKSIYSVSRKKLLIKFKMIMDIFLISFKNCFLNEFQQFEMIYLNGNKAAFVFLLKNKFAPFKGKVVWHLRDYYHSSFIMDKAWKLLMIKKLSFICNSYSVKQSLLDSIWGSYPIEVIYNPVGDILHLRDSTKPIVTLGFVSMLTPWKGVHEIILWSNLYEKELEGLGVTNIKIYGEHIYRTNDSFEDYEIQLAKLSQKFPSKLVSFEGRKNPSEIYQEIDCLIHYSLTPEPFGRVIIEALEAGVPVVSTCLGGAAELVDGYDVGMRVFPYDRNGLYRAIEQLINNEAERFCLISKGIEKSQLIQKNITQGIKNVLLEEVA